MGKKHTLFSKNRIGNMAIKLDRFYYAPGDLMTGMVFFNCTQAAVCDGLVLKFTGKEEAEWDDCRSRMVEDDDGDAGERLPAATAAAGCTLVCVMHVGQTAETEDRS